VTQWLLEEPLRGARSMRSLLLFLWFGALLACRPLLPPGSGTDAERAWAAGVESPPVSLQYAGIALSLDLREAGGAYDGWLWEIAQVGANAVTLVVTGSQADVRSSNVDFRSPRTVQDNDLRQAIRSAHALGLAVTLFPIVWIEERAPGEWRGRLAPDDPPAWFASYGEGILRLATIAAEEGVDSFSVGSEFGSLESSQGFWRRLIADVRGVFEGTLLYSANWDHAHRTPFWDALDRIGVTGYYELADQVVPDAALELDPDWARQVEERWVGPIEDLVALSERWDRPIRLTEVGYPSVSTAASRPWDHTVDGERALLLQASLYRAFTRAWAGVVVLDGVSFWNWFGPGGPDDLGYTPRQKPSEVVLRAWMRQRQ
jgi:hypothetical protein